MLTPESLAELRRLLDAYDATTHDAQGLFMIPAPEYTRVAWRAVVALPALLDAAAERDALAAKVEAATGALIDAGYRAAEDRSEADALRAMLAGRCLSDITHRDEEHRQSVCMLPKDHAPLAHDDCMGCTWTDADHWEPSAIDALAEECDGWRHLADVRAARIARVRALADWHETKADKARRFRIEIDGQNPVMDKAAEVHADAARRIRRALDADNLDPEPACLIHDVSGEDVRGWEMAECTCPAIRALDGEADR